MPQTEGGQMTPSTAVILCGGQGTRLRPITYEIPKALIPIHGKPVVEHLFDLLLKYDVTDVLLSVGYLKERIRAHCGDGSRYGLRIRYLEEDEPLGTGGPLLLGKRFLTETFIVSNGDELKDINIAEMAALHRRSSATATVALTEAPDPSQYGVARLAGSQILAFVEKPPRGQAPSNMISAGFYIMEPAAIGLVRQGFCMLEKDVFPVLAKQGRLFGFPFPGQWFDTGNFQRYEQAIKEWKGIRQAANR